MNQQAVNISTIIRRATLTIDGKDYRGDVNANNTIDFDDIDATIDGDDTTSFSLAVELFGSDNHFATTSESLTFSINSNTSGDVDIEGSDTGDASDVSGSVNGNKQTIAVNAGVNVEGVSMSGTQTYNSNFPNASYGTFTLKFDVTANGDDVYIPKSTQQIASTSNTTTAGVAYSTDLNASSTSSTVTASLTSTADTDPGNSSYYVIHDGDTETFTLTVTVDPTATGDYQVGLNAIRFSTTDNGNGLQTLDIDQYDDQFNTDSLNIRNS